MGEAVSLVGPGHARMMLYTGARLDAQEAQRIGLINRVVTDEMLSETVLDLARTIADNAPLSVRAAKLAVDEMVKDESDATWRRSCGGRRRASTAPTTGKGRAAFMEKRAPRFIGR